MVRQIRGKDYLRLQQHHIACIGALRFDMDVAHIACIDELPLTWMLLFRKHIMDIYICQTMHRKTTLSTVVTCMYEVLGVQDFLCCLKFLLSI